MNIKKITFYNQVINRGVMRQMIGRLVGYLGNHYTAQILDQLKTLGFRYATQTGISLGIDDLLTTPSKKWLIQDAEKQAKASINQCKRGSIHAVEKLRQVVETWHITSEYLKNEMSFNFKITDPLNPVHMMSFSGARGSVSQVHQLVGMRGLMADPQGQIIDLPIQSNLREGLSLTEYIISCYGARKGVVDTAIRTADAGYLTRRLVEVAQNVVVNNTDCETGNGIQLDALKSHSSSGVINLPLEERLIGRVIAKTLIINNRCIVVRNHDISAELAQQLGFYKKSLLIRSPLTCANMPRICRLCYGWDLSYGNLVELGEAIGIVAGQSIGEPGTQLTLRTFHTGGVFSGDVAEHVRAPFNGILDFKTDFIKPTRNRHGKPAWICCSDLEVSIQGNNERAILNVPVHSLLLVRKQQFVRSRQILAEVRSTTSPLKEQVSKGTYTDIQGEVVFQKNFSSIYSPLFRKLVRLTPTNATYLWVKSYRIFAYSFIRKKYLTYYDQDHINANVPLGKCVNKYKSVKPILNIKTGVLNVSRYNISNIVQKNKYQWMLIMSAKDQFKLKIDSFQTHRFRQQEITELKHIRLYALDQQQLSITNQFQNIKNIVDYFNNLFLSRQTKMKPKSMNNILFKGFLGKSYKTFYGTYKLIYHKKNIIVQSLNYSVDKPKIYNQIYQKVVSLKKCILSEYLQQKTFFIKSHFYWTPPVQQKSLFIKKFFMDNLGNFLSQDSTSGCKESISEAGQILGINNHYCNLHLAKPYLITPKGSVYVNNKEPVLEGKTLLSLIYERLKTSDITQGLPKAEQLLEARPNNEVSINLQQYFEDWTKRMKKYLLLPYSVFIPKLIQHSQIDLVNRIQAVYLAQGVFTSDKHIEVIVRQMTSKVVVVEHNDPTAISSEGVVRWSLKSKTHSMYLYLPGELIEFKQAQRIYRALEEPLPYKPLLLGVTKASLNTESFISEASFERTANVLSKSAFEGRIDWMKGLKENIIFGGMIPTGTGCKGQNFKKILPEIPTIKNSVPKISFSQKNKSKICYRVRFHSFSKKKLHSDLQQSMYIKYNYSAYSSISNRSLNNFISKDLIEFPINNDFFML